ncbi:MAG: chloride channel protein [Clostridia bacterium]|nr:chloride channel protein [Clostridia bacterium]
MKRYRHEEYLAHTLPFAGRGAITGLFVGVTIFFFKLIAEKLEELSHHIYEGAHENPMKIVLIFAGLIFFATLMYLLHKKIPEVKGGGIPRSEGILRGILKLRWLRTFFGTLAGSLISFFCGVPLGSEGPSVLIGTSMAHGLNPLKHGEATNRELMTGGACAGFAVATGSPLTAVLFVLEEVHRRITPSLLLVASSSAICATAVNYILCAIFEINPVLFDIGAVVALEMSHIGYILILAVIVAVAVNLFDAAVFYFQIFMEKHGQKIPPYAKILFIFLLTGVVGIFAPEALFGGRGIILGVVGGEEMVYVILLLLVWRAVMMLFTSASGVTGGIFVPTLAIGALVGALGANLLVVLGMPDEYFGTMVLIAMCAFMGGSMRAPLTAAVFFIEATAQYTSVFYLAIVVFFVYFTTNLPDREAFYDLVLDGMEKAQHRGIKRRIMRFEAKVSDNAFIIGKPSRDILWPHSAVITAITRADRHHRAMDNDGEKKFYAGDTLVIRVQLYNEEYVTNYLYDLVGRQYEMTVTEIDA